MQRMPQNVPISEMKLNQPAVLTMLENGPVLLNNRSKGVAVLVDVEQWNRLMEQLEDQADIIDALEAKLDIATGKAEWMSEEELEEWLAEDETVPA